MIFSSLALHSLTFAFTFWLGLYLIARSPGDKHLLFTGLGLLAYSEAIFLSALAAQTSLAIFSELQWSIIFFPAVFWTATLIQLLPETLKLKPQLYRLWLYSVFPLSIILFALSMATPFFVQGSSFGPGVFLFAAISLVPLLISFTVSLRHFRSIQANQSIIFILLATLFFGLAAGALLLPLEVFPRNFTMFGLGVDLIILGLAIAFFDAFDLGENLIPDMSRSFISTALLNFIFAGQIIVVSLSTGLNTALVLLLFSSISLLTGFQAFSSPLQNWLDKLTFAGQPRLQKERADLRAVSSAVVRVRAQTEAFKLSDDDFNRLTRKALTNFSDLSRLGSSPLTQLALINKRLDDKGLKDDTLSRAQELKQVLLESVLKLKPPAERDFASTDEWRYYNVLFFPYIMGVKPFSQRADHDHLDVTAKEALEYFRTYVPERTFYNWQKQAAELIAKNLQEQGERLKANIELDG